MGFLKRFRIRRILKYRSIPADLWQQSLKQTSCTHHLTAVERVHLRELATRVMVEKNFIGIGIEVDTTMQVLIAICACLPVLHLGLKQLHGWEDILIYPGLFVVDRDEKNPDGVVQHRHKILGGETWQNGPLILAWDHLLNEINNPQTGRNVVIHEIAHKLDFLNGRCNGMPPLHPDMSIPEWSDTLSKAYIKLQHHPSKHIDEYASYSPAEFFAVCSEYFFCKPELLDKEVHGVYQQLGAYYRQDPLLPAIKN